MKKFKPVARSPQSRLIVASAAALLLTGCHTGPDYGPIGDGLKAIAVCVVVYGVVQALADLVKGGGEQPNPPPPPAPPRRPRPRKDEQERR